MAKTWCICKSGALAMIGIPSRFEGSLGLGSIGFNAGKIYGKSQLQHLFANWKQGKINQTWMV